MNIVCAEVIGVSTTVSRENISTALINKECDAEKFENMLHCFSIEIILDNYLWTLGKYTNEIRRNVKYVNTDNFIFFFFRVIKAARVSSNEYRQLYFTRSSNVNYGRKGEF